MLNFDVEYSLRDKNGGDVGAGERSKNYKGGLKN